MSIFVIISILVMGILTVVIIWLTYKHFQRKENEKQKKEFLQKKYYNCNFEEVSLKALEKPKESLGKLVYSLQYFPDFEQLKVLIKSGHDLLAMDPGGKSDPYVKVWIKDEPKVKFQTKIKKRTLNPVFNEEFTFTVHQEAITTTKLIFMVFDYDRFSKHDLIGCLNIDLSQLDLSKTVEDWAELEPEKEEDNDVPLGDVCLSLKHVPDEEKLYVAILEAKNIKEYVEEPISYSDPFIKILLTEGGKKLKKKMTTIKTHTPNPYFNEEFCFNLPKEITNKVQLFVIVYNCDGNVKNSMPIGNAILGSGVTGSGLKHWKEMIANPKRATAHWHSLVDVIELKK